MSRDVNFVCRIHPTAHSDIDKQQWVTGLMVDTVPRWRQSLSWPIRIRWYGLWWGTYSWQDPVHSWKAGPGKVMTVEIFSTLKKFLSRHDKVCYFNLSSEKQLLFTSCFPVVWNKLHFFHPFIHLNIQWTNWDYIFLYQFLHLTSFPAIFWRYLCICKFLHTLYHSLYLSTVCSFF